MWVNSSAAACLTATCTTDISRSLFTGNRATAAGALALLASRMEYTISHSKFAANMAVNGSAGALVYRGYSSLTSSGSSAPQSKLSIRSTELNVAIAANQNCQGGAVFANLNGTNMHLESCIFEENTVVTTADSEGYFAPGGGMYVMDFREVHIINGTFLNNKGKGRQLKRASAATNCVMVASCSLHFFWPVEFGHDANCQRHSCLQPLDCAECLAEQKHGRAFKLRPCSDCINEICTDYRLHPAFATLTCVASYN